MRKTKVYKFNFSKIVGEVKVMLSNYINNIGGSANLQIKGCLGRIKSWVICCCDSHKSHANIIINDAEGNKIRKKHKKSVEVALLNDLNSIVTNVITDINCIATKAVKQVYDFVFDIRELVINKSKIKRYKAQFTIDIH